MVRGVGGPIGIRSAVAAGAAGSGNVQNEIAQMQRDQIHLLVGTPAKICEVMTARGGLGGGEVRLLIVRNPIFYRDKNPLCTDYETFRFLKKK